MIPISGKINNENDNAANDDDTYNNYNRRYVSSLAQEAWLETKHKLKKHEAK